MKKIIVKTIKISILIYILFIGINAILFFTIGPDYQLWIKRSSYKVLPIYKMIENGDIEIIKSRRNIKDQKWEYILKGNNIQHIPSEFKKIMAEIAQYTDKIKNKTTYTNYLTEKYRYINLKYESYIINSNNQLSIIELLYNENINELYLSFSNI